MNDRAVVSEWCGRPLDRGTWIDHMQAEGIDCRFHASTSAMDSASVDWHPAGDLCIGDAELAAVSLSAAPRHRAQLGEHVFLKVVQSGSVTIEQNGRMHRFDAGSMLMVDPSYSFSDHYSDMTRVALLRMPRNALKDRGLRYSFHEPHLANLFSADVQAVREFMARTARQAGATSQTLRERFGQQCLDLLDVVLENADDAARGRANALTVLRTRQIVLRSLADPDLSVNGIAAELNMSASALTRALKTAGLSPMRYAWTLRLEQAARLLSGTAKHPVRVKEVAYRCGFSDAAHFSRAFKARYGMSPRDFALQNAGALAA
ncbi:helix-turn-helix domain-containing protein [Paraburkholderia sp. DHOC27]|uniref:helix-turn-helix domain-containing protein n=1 Tax=Paraburkholderia sp. DHOC27 TaxID=2303330 RepID=UPI000E3E3B7D|nr:helix-turn-helix domain-containing protein [Paraburkholderia sp. DHOC27]RFU49574.1 helix-turn-helix domain-containing protein [Paraburkholderia sp. DHOC27]